MENTPEEYARAFRDLSQLLKRDITPKSVANWTPAERAWMLEHIEMLLVEAKELQERIQRRLDASD